MAKSDFSFNSGLMRLQDPVGVAKDRNQLLLCQKLVSDAMTMMAKFSKHGGNPFLFTFTATKPHTLVREVPDHTSDTGKREINTACTDSITYSWNPEFLASLTPKEVQTIMGHETFHVVFFHCMEDRRQGREIGLWGTVIDYLANAALLDDHVKSGRATSSDFRDLWTWSFPDSKDPKKMVKITPVTLQMYWDYIDGNLDKIPEPLVFSDLKSLEYTCESLYDEFIRRFENSPRRCKEKSGGCGSLSIDPKTGQSKIPKPWDKDSCPKCGAKRSGNGGGHGGHGAGLKLPQSCQDSHVKIQKNRQEIMSEAMRASDQCRMLGRGEVPGSIEGLLQQLKEPELSPSELMVHALYRKIADEGENNDWTRFRRRPTFIMRQNALTGIYEPGDRLFVPRKYEFAPKWVGLVDTSGSMSERDIANGVKEYKIVARIQGAEGWLVSVDAAPHWDSAQRITQSTELQRFKIVGRGGTVFRQFFEELPSKMGRDIDLVAIVTDGMIDEVPTNLAPPCETIWIITSDFAFVPPFGRVVKLNQKRPL